MGAADRAGTPRARRRRPSVDNVSITCTSNAYTLGGTASGLKGSVVLTNNGTDLTVNQNGVFTFGSSVKFNTAYAVTVRTNPAGQTCSVSNGSGTVGAGNVTNIGVTCTDNRTPSAAA